MKQILIIGLCILFSINVFSQTKDSTVTFNVQKTEELVFVKVEQNATFQGGTIADFRNWVSTQIIYPEEALKIEAQGMVVIQFVVSSKGIVNNLVVLRSSGYQILDNEAMRVILSSPTWVPARQGGVEVAQQFVLPVSFKLAP
jgi:TonB family protein